MTHPQAKGLLALLGHCRLTLSRPPPHLTNQDGARIERLAWACQQALMTGTSLHWYLAY